MIIFYSSSPIKLPSKELEAVANLILPDSIDAFIKVACPTWLVCQLYCYRLVPAITLSAFWISGLCAWFLAILP